MVLCKWLARRYYAVRAEPIHKPIVEVHALTDKIIPPKRLLDLYCGAGGAAMGYFRAGFTEIVGIDIEPQPRYPFTFIQGDALAPPVDLSRFDAIHASPPCQAYSVLRVMKNARIHADLVEMTRALLRGTGKPYVIENVFGAPLEYPIMLCGSFFGLQSNGFGLQRHRYFESNVCMLSGHVCVHTEATMGVYGAKVRNIAQEKRHYAKDKSSRGQPTGVLLPNSYGQEAMGIDWMKIKELAQAIPPAYTEFIGRHLLSVL